MTKKHTFFALKTGEFERTYVSCDSTSCHCEAVEGVTEAG